MNLLTRFEQRNATDRAAVAAVDVWADILGEYKYFSPRITLIEMPPTIIQVKVKPNSRVSRLEQQEDRQGLSAVLPGPAGAVVVAGAGGVRLLRIDDAGGS